MLPTLEILRRLVKAAATASGVSPAGILDRNRLYEHCLARHTVWHFAVLRLEIQQMELSRLWLTLSKETTKYNHATIGHGLKRIEEALATDGREAIVIRSIERQLEDVIQETGGASHKPIIGTVGAIRLNDVAKA